jgi:hypothetical protein
MSLADLLSVIAWTVVAAVLALRVVPERRLVRRLLADGAIVPEKATGAPEDGGRVGRALRRLEDGQIVRRTPDGRIYLDQEAHAAQRQSRRVRALGLAAVALLAALVIALVLR